MNKQSKGFYQMQVKGKITKTIYQLSSRPDDKSLDLYIYDDVVSDSYDWWNDQKIESETSAGYIQRELEKAIDVEFINLYINSFGGDVKEGIGIYNILKRHKSFKTAYIDGFACSIASVIPMCCDKIIMGVNTMMMLHHAWTVAMGNAQELRKAANDIEAIDIASSQSYMQRAGNKLSENKLNELLDNETWLGAKECMQFGLCDEIAGAETSLDNQKQAKQNYLQSLQKINQFMAPPVIKALVNQSENDLDEDIPKEEQEDFNSKPEDPLIENIDNKEIPQEIIEKIFNAFFNSIKK